MFALLIGLPGGSEWIIILLAILLFFGAKKIPELARGIGQGMKEFRRASDDIRKEIENGSQDTENTANNSSSNTK